jgi:phosphoribosylanthranilate isomerase
MKVKICGITDLATGVAAVKYGADAIGFVFAESKRQVALAEAKEIVENLPTEVLKVGVFVNETKEEIERVAALVGLTHIQLHGDETALFCESISLPVIKALSIKDEESFEEMKQFSSEYILLDGPKGKYRGGNGISFDWKTIDPSNFAGRKVILAGGLNEGNVESAIKTMKPYMIDVSSGVETNGKKDLKKIKSFIEKAKEA